MVNVNSIRPFDSMAACVGSNTYILRDVVPVIC